MTSSNEFFFALLVLFVGIHRWFPSQKPVTRSFEVFFDLLNKRFSQSLTPSNHISSGDNGPLAVTIYMNQQ